MGYRLHAATLYKVEYGAGTFNHESEKINHLLTECPSFIYYGDDYDTSTEIEVDRSDLTTLIHRLRSDEFAEHYEEEYDIGTDRNFIADELQSFLDEADPDNEFIHLSWY